MNPSQRSNIPIFQHATPSQRWIALGILVMVGGLFTYLWLTGTRRLEPDWMLSVCGFQQRTGLPCPGCYWTRAGQAFATGHILRSFYIQPAAAVFYSVAFLAAIFALLSAVFGIQYSPTNRFRSKRWTWKIVAAGGLIILAAWILELVRTILEIEFV
jgi:hypothetical protein